MAAVCFEPELSRPVIYFGDPEGRPGMSSPPQNVTGLLIQWSEGDTAAFEQLLPIVYAELRQMARRQMAGQNPGHTLQPTALIHEAYLRLGDGTKTSWQNRAHFFGLVAAAMRHVLVDAARARGAAKRGGAQQRVPLDEALIPCGRSAELVALDDALKTLATLHPRQARVVELRYFAGLDVKESAAALDVSEETVTRDWRAAKSWLYRELHGASRTGPT